MLEIKGRVVKGLSAASGKNENLEGRGSIYHQVEFLNKTNAPLAKELFLCKMATINIGLKHPLEIMHWEHVFEEVFWLPHSATWFEKISFTPIDLMVNPPVNAWLYKAWKSPHNDNNRLLEVIAPHIDHISYGDVCTINIESKYVK